MSEGLGGGAPLIKINMQKFSQTIAKYLVSENRLPAFCSLPLQLVLASGSQNVFYEERVLQTPLGASTKFHVALLAPTPYAHAEAINVLLFTCPWTSVWLPGQHNQRT
jgi:hypothetical protein